jgi:hypothetical protein
MRAVSYENSALRNRFADTVVLPTDELAARRQRKRNGHLSPRQIQSLLAAAALRERATQCERDD